MGFRHSVLSLSPDHQAHSLQFSFGQSTRVVSVGDAYSSPPACRQILDGSYVPTSEVGCYVGQ